MEIFIREDGDIYRVFFGPETIGCFHKDKLDNITDLENVIRNISYKYYYAINPPNKGRTVRYVNTQKNQGILKDIVDIFW